EDIRVIKEIVLEPIPKLDDDDDDYYYDYYRDNPIEEDAEKKSDRNRVPLTRKGSVFRRSSVNPKAQYDIAILLTGVNDLKEQFMPHMMTKKSGGDRKLQTELHRVLEALQDKMGTMDLDGKSKDRSCRTSSQLPLVVMPELPVAPLQLFQLVPLCWFLVPIFRAMENNKRHLASCFPDNVVFVEQPETDWWTDTESGIGPVREHIQQEQLLLRITDIGRKARGQIQDVMKQFYGRGQKEGGGAVEEAAVEDDSSDSCVIANDNRIRMMDDHDHLHYDEDRADHSTETSNQPATSNLVSEDQIHPNDEGYELWGRHIAAAIIEHWDQDSE
ncbi:MAG: hypothetical protein SGARI_006437, partial [Bacillariaceae sp.]